MKHPNEINILIGCEESQTVCKAFRALGFNAFSNDLKECSGGCPEWHLEMDVFEAIKSRKWDFIGLHPVCTKMTLSGNRHYGVSKDRYSERVESVEWTIGLWKAACQASKHVYMENPMGAMNTDRRLPKPQIIQPYYFGDEAQKTTCIWLYGLPYLIHNDRQNIFESEVTHVGRGEMVTFKSGKSMPKWYAETPSTKSESNRAIRSKTYPGIAANMAKQWGEFILNSPL